MKLVISIVSEKDAHSLLDQLIQKGYRATKLASAGGFLREGNATLLIGVEEGEVEAVLGIISEICQSRQQIVAPISSMPGPAESYMPFPIEVTVGGATIFVLEVEKSLKV